MLNSHGKIEVELERICDECDGEGGSVTDSGWTRCGFCEGSGYLPTATGLKFLSLMRHNFKPMLDDYRESGD